MRHIFRGIYYSTILGWPSLFAAATSSCFIDGKTLAYFSRGHYTLVSKNLLKELFLFVIIYIFFTQINS